MECHGEKYIFCPAQCGLYLAKLQEELADQQQPILYMKDRYIAKLNEHFSNGNIRVRREHLLFTDWELSEEGRLFGLEGVEEIKQVIKEHLIQLNVINRHDIKELEAAVSPPIQL